MHGSVSGYEEQVNLTHRITHLATLLADLAAGILNLLLARQEHQDVARRLAAVDLNDCADCCLQIIPLRLLQDRAITASCRIMT